MASIERRAPRSSGGDVTWRVRYRDPSGQQKSKSFLTKTDARRYKAIVEADVLRGAYVDLSLGKMRVGEYAELWLGVQTFGETTREAVTIRVRRHIIPGLGMISLANLRPLDIQGWVRKLQDDLAASTIDGVMGTLTTILAAAVEDGRIAKNPAKSKSIRLPRSDADKVVPWTDRQVLALAGALPDAYAIMMPLITGLGLRQGEVFGLSVDDVDFMKQVVHVRRQVKIVSSRLVFDLPKYGKTREVPLAPKVAQLISAHLESRPAQAVSLPWRVADGREEQHRLLLTTREGKALNRNYINTKIWRPARAAAGFSDRRGSMHGGRHFFASVQLEGGTNIRALADYLGHHDPGFTLRVYTHLMPAAESKAREAVDAVYTRLEVLNAEPSVSQL